MSWLFGIPDFSLAQGFTYFNDLMDTSHNVEKAKIKKEQLYGAASAAASGAINALSSTESLKQATDFLYNIAISEREKEIMVVKAYSKKIGKDFPFLNEYNPEEILKNPDEFYAQLTAAINEARRGTEKYLKELYRIKSNIEEHGRTLENYKQDDYRYRISGDIESFLHRLNGTFKLNEKISEENYSIKIQQMVMKILEKMDIPSRIESGEDFAAIASATLIDIEARVQEEIDKQIKNNDKKKDISTITDTALKAIEDKYLTQLERQETDRSPVQKAINDIMGIDFLRVTQNAKELLGINKISGIAELNKRAEKIQRLYTARNKKEKSIRNVIKDMRQSLKRNTKLSSDLQSINFSISGSAQSKHGTMYELIESLLGRNVKGNVAVDIITYDFGYTLEQNNAFYDQLISNISQELSSVILDEKDDSESNLRDIRKSLLDMNTNINQLIEKAEEQLQKEKNADIEQLFVYHETLKLYSSVETGRSKDGAYHGRNMNILSFIDYMDTASIDSFSLAINRDLLNFLALNLSPNAVAASAKGPLENYFSIFAGLLMFDDVHNMALEAAQIAQKNTHIKQIHLYNLNGIYVPASMLLSYVSDAVSAASQYVESGIAARASIHVPSSNKTYEKYKEGKLHGNSGRTYYRNELRPEHWQAVGAESASQTKVTIIFLAAFQQFINKLSSL